MRTGGSARDDGDRPEEESPRAEPVFSNPKPWETVVRIRVLSPIQPASARARSSTVPRAKSLILTCATSSSSMAASRRTLLEFPHQIMIDLFDGNLQGTNPARVHFLESVAGKAVDYDFTRDVGLIRIRPGRRLPSSRVVPAHWQPKAHMQVLTVGCSEGNDATVWPTVIKRPRILNFLSGNPSYEAVECDVAPKQGRSGGGLFTTDGYVAGVCNFAEPQGDHGLYATPRSIYTLLDRNNMMALYAPITRRLGRPAGRRPAWCPSQTQPRGPGRPLAVAGQRGAGEKRGPRRQWGRHDPAPQLAGDRGPRHSRNRAARTRLPRERPGASAGT